MPGLVEERRTYTATEARTNFSDLFDEAYHNGPVIVRKHKREVAIVPLRLLAALEAAQEALDAEASLRDYKENGGVSLKELKDELGLESK